jgi:hypothetical protein
VRRTPLWNVIGHREGELFETKKLLKVLGQILHLGQNGILRQFLDTAMALGAIFDESGGEWVVPVTREWYKYIRCHTSILVVFLYGFEINWDRFRDTMEGSRASQPNTRGWSDALNKDKFHRDSSDKASAAD